MRTTRHRPPLPQDVSRPGPATLHDVATVAGVSIMTVSNVVNGRFKSMRAETRARVESAIKQLDYRPHAIARSLRQARSLTIGMLIVDETQSYLTDPFIAQITAGLCKTLGDRSYGLLLHGASARQVEQTVFLQNVRTDGVCLFLSGSDKLRHQIIARVAQLEEPLLVFQEMPGLQVKDHCIVRQADFEGGYALAQHLLEKGGRRFVLLAPQVTWPGATQRLRGVQRGLAAVPKGDVRILRFADMRTHSIDGILRRHLMECRAPDAIIALNDQMGTAALKALKERGISVPRTTMVTGFNAFEFWQYTEPLLTSVASRAYEMGTAAAEAMMNRLEGGRWKQSEIVLPVDLRIGGST